MLTLTGKRKKTEWWLMVGLIFPALLYVYLVSTSCDPRYLETDSAASFKKVYDKPLLHGYTAVDIRQTPSDKGYIILGICDGVPYLLKLDKYGNYLWDTCYETFSLWSIPIPELILVEREGEPDTYYFFCHKTTGDGQPVVLLKISAENNVPGEPREISLSAHLPEDHLVLPMEARAAPGPVPGFLLLALDVSTNKVILIKLDHESNAAWDNPPVSGFSHICANSFHVSDGRFHFIGFLPTQIPGKDLYYFHSYLDSQRHEYPSCFGITVIDPISGSPLVEYPSPLAFLTMDNSGSTASGALLIENIIAFFVNRSLTDLNETIIIIQFELVPSKPVYMKTMNVNEQKAVFFVGSGKNDKIVLYAYDWSTGSFAAKEYFGHTNVYESAGLIETGDGGLAILGTTYLAGQLGRICIFKLSKQELEDLMGQL
ncbi:MAG: hypothetical protein GTO45_04110 [Candidatus Aminicenantes bacterium]|nr:hypothetical protein [Candidatus Aminicenantes bacterium]NIM77912.1 hypothetical protein [Candidatus Aminicenantes bacterium]NIN17229.1 hypothetical protein [Candidatus Aminicenantes bacterium]NIN41116.1 hypothetical protein [Candidatus Aminicenantes bacterium]NIN83922.1 hypothetical protein [Candidatus Aminicenantes bacterium]